MPISIPRLEYALAVEKHRHFGMAASNCHVTQPTLSHQIQKLENEIGIVLFDRQKKPILPTPEGIRFLEQARALIRERDKLLFVTSQCKSSEIAGEFRLGIIPTVASDFLPFFIEPFSKSYPQVQLLIEEMKTETILDEINHDRLDGAVLATPVAGADVKVLPLYYETFSIYFSKNHSLLAHSAIRRGQLDLSEMWLLEDGHCFKDQILDFCRARRSQNKNFGNIHFRSGNLETLRKLVEHSRGFTLLPAMMAANLSSSTREQHVRIFQNPQPTREIGLIYRRDHWKHSILNAIEETVARQLPKVLTKIPTKQMNVLEVKT